MNRHLLGSMLLLCLLALASLPAACLAVQAPAALPAPNDPAYAELQWAPQAVGALEGWASYPARYFSAADRPQHAPLIALIDTGVDVNHPDFRNPGASGADISQGGQLVLSLARTFLSGEPGDGSAEVRDEHGHGTHLAGLIAGAVNNTQGIAGLGYPLRLLPLKVAGADGATTHEDLARALIYAAEAGCSVIVIGFSGASWSQTLQEAVDYAWDRGCLMLAPAGDGMGALASYPAACPHVMGIGALTASGAVASYSSQGGYVALSAPGGDDITGIYSSLPTYACTLRQDGTSPIYGWLYGTAQAAAHVAAAAGLEAGLRGVTPFTGEEGRNLWQALQQTAGAPEGGVRGEWRAGFGRGRLALGSLLAGEVGSGTGGIVGRVLVNGAPAAGVTVGVWPTSGAEETIAMSQYPAGAYRVPNLAPGEYAVTATSGDLVGRWEKVIISPGCDEPAIDFRLGDPLAGAEVVDAAVPASAVRGSTMQISFTMKNTGASTWRRAEGYRVKQVMEGIHTTVPGEMPPGEAVSPGQVYNFSFNTVVPDLCGFIEASWQLSQEGGQGRFGDIVSGRISVTSFLDVPADHWAVQEIEAAKSANLVKGYEDFTYHPDAAVTRDQMAVYLARAVAGGDANVPLGPEQATFPDVPTTHWAYRYVEYAYANEIVQGYPEGVYGPEQELDRGQMAAFIARGLAGGETALSSYTPPELASFPDVPSDAWMYRYVEYVKAQQVVKGYDDGCYHPEVICTRDQMAVYLARAFL